jgi:hypothetical protein
VDVLRITFRTIPSGIVATANAPYKNLVGFKVADADQAAAVFIAPLALGIERIMGLGYVAGAFGTEDVDPAGMLIDYLDVTVAFESAAAGAGSFEQIVRIPVHFFDSDVIFGSLVLQPLADAYAGLQALAAV